MERTIRVTGKGKLSVKPDTIRLIMTVEGTQNEYDKAVQRSAEMTEEIKDLFEQSGFDKNSVRTLYFNVNAEYESYQARDKSWKRRLTGYKFVHRMKIEFPMDNKLLGKILFALGHSELRPEFDIEYTVSDTEKTKNELLRKAVADSKEKAYTLTQAADVSLGSIITIDYSWDEIKFVTKPVNRMMLEASCGEEAMYSDNSSYDIDIAPDDIDVTDSVTVVWAIL